MLNRKAGENASASATPQHNSVETLIGDHTVFTGDIEFKGGLLRVEGLVKGSIKASVESDAVLILAQSGRVEGNVDVPNVVVNGMVTGNIHSTKRIELEGNAKVIGDIKYTNIEMSLGAVINGSLVRDSAGAPKAASASSEAKPAAPKA